MDWADKGRPMRVWDYRLGIDPVSGESLHHASFLLRHFLPVELVRDEAHQKVIEGDLGESTPSVISLSGQTTDTEWKLMTGSRSEGLGVPEHWRGGAGSPQGLVAADRDIMICTPNWYHMEVPPEAKQYREGPLFDIEDLDDPDFANYARLKPSASLRAARLSTGRPVITQYYDNSELKESVRKRYQHRSSPFTVELCGPSVAMLGHQFGPAMDRDNCISIAFAHWPDVASEWPTRHRPSRWPSKLLTTDISSRGFFMVPVGRRNSPQHDIEWRYSFSLAERTLARSLSPIVRKTYVILKLLHSFYLKEPSVLPTYAIKTLLFWFCETHHVSEWTEGDVAGLVYCLLDQVLLSLVTKQVRHYFIPHVNLLALAPMQAVLTLAKRVKFVRRNLVQCITTIADGVQFLGLNSGCESFTWLPSFKGFINSMSAPQDVDLFRRSARDMLMDILEEYVRRIRVNEDNSDAGGIGQLKQAYRQRFLRMLRSVAHELADVDGRSTLSREAYGEFLLDKLPHCTRGDRSERLPTLAKVFVWLYRDKFGSVGVSEMTNLCTRAMNVASTTKQRGILQKMAEGIPSIPNVIILADSYSLYKQYFLDSTAETNTTTLGILGDFLRKQPNVAPVSLVGAEMWRETMFQNFNRAGRVSCYRFGLDASSGTSLHHVSFLLRHFLPIEVVRDETQQKLMECDNSDSIDIDDLLKTGPKSTKRTQALMTGSLAEGLGVPDYMLHTANLDVQSRDKDEMLCELNWYQVKENLPMEFEHHREGPLFEIEAIEGGEASYARLKFSHGYRVAKEAITGKALQSVYLSNEVPKEQLLAVHKGVLGDLRVPFKLELHGPCVTQLHDTTDRDECIAFAFKGWPEVASDWLTRRRRSGWPSGRIISDAEKKGFFMVPVGRQDVEGSELEWRYSFSHLERTLARSLPVVVRKAYILLKLLHSFYMKEPCVLPTYCLKTLLFWFCEQHRVSQWTEADMAGVLMCLLDQLLQALATQEVRHYFIPTVNLLKRASPGDVKTLAQIILGVRRNLPEHIISIAKKVSFMGIGGTRRFTDHLCLSNFLDSMKSSPRDRSLFRRTSAELLGSILEEYIGHVRGNEKVRDEGSIGLLKQANRLRYLRILHDVILEMKCAADDDGDDVESSPYNTFLLLRLSEQREEPLLLAKLYVWLRDYHISMVSLEELHKTARDDKRASNLLSVVRDSLPDEGGPLISKQKERLEAMQRCMDGFQVQGLEVPRDSAEIYKQYYRVLNADTYGPIISQASSVPPATDSFSALASLFGSFKTSGGAPVTDINQMLKATQEAMSWMQSQQKRK